MKDKRVLVTGGLGFIGSNLAHRLVSLGAKVTLIDAMIPDSGGNWYNIAGIQNQVEVHLTNMLDKDRLADLVCDQEVIFNLAGHVSHVDSMTNPALDLEINVTAQLALLETCRYVNPEVRIVHTATRQQYGQPLYMPIKEDHPLNPVDINGIHKTAGEHYFLIYHQVYGMRTTSLRLTNIYGTRQLIAHNRQGFMGWFIRRVLHSEAIELFGDGTQVRDVCYVEDVVDALLLSASSEKAIGEVYNVGGVRPVSLKEVAETLIELRGEGSYRLVPFPPDRKRINVQDFQIDSSKIREHLGWQPRVDLREGLQKTLAYYETCLDHYLYVKNPL